MVAKVYIALAGLLFILKRVFSERTHHTGEKSFDMLIPFVQ
jgi:hypothetical protein